MNTPRHLSSHIAEDEIAIGDILIRLVRLGQPHPTNVVNHKRCPGKKHSTQVTFVDGPNIEMPWGRPLEHYLVVTHARDKDNHKDKHTQIWMHDDKMDALKQMLNIMESDPTCDHP